MPEDLILSVGAGILIAALVIAVIYHAGKGPKPWDEKDPDKGDQ